MAHGAEGGGGGYFHIYWVCAARETPIFNPRFPVRSISFSQNVKIFRSEASPFYIPETIIFEIYLRVSRLSLPTAGLLSRAPRARSGALFTLPRHIPTKIWGEFPPPPPPPHLEFISNNHFGEKWDNIWANRLIFVQAMENIFGQETSAPPPPEPHSTRTLMRTPHISSMTPRVNNHQ